MSLETFADAQDVLAKTLPNYTRRPHQMDLAAQIEAAMSGGKNILAQAGCGTGKSMAILIPLILSGKRSVIGTPTKALQNQYLGDLEFLAEHLGVPVSYALLKGRSNYPCALRIDELKTKIKEHVLAGLTDAQEAALKVYSETDPLDIIDRETLPSMSNAEWNAMSISTTECPGKKACPFGNVCMTERAKAKAQASQLVVTNLTYFMLDRRLEEQSAGAMSLLGEFEYVAIDEAHQLYDKATDALTDSMGQNGLVFLARDIESFLHDHHRGYATASHIREAAAKLWAQLEDKFRSANGPKKEDPVRLRTPDLLAVGDEIMELRSALKAAAEAVASISREELDGDPKAFLLKGRLERRAADWSGRLGKVLTDQTTVNWLEAESKPVKRGWQETRTEITLWWAPLSPAPFLQRVLFDKHQTTMLSATLTTGSDQRTRWDFTRQEQLALPAGETTVFDAGTPFDFSTQAMLYVPAKGRPEPTRETMNAWRSMVQTETRMLVEAAQGNSLLLYTSRSAMEEAYGRLAEDFTAKGLRPLKQGDLLAPELIREFKKGGGVLFGLKTFFEGIDIQGDALRLVMLDKLPFSVPTDILHSARGEDIVRRYGKGADFGRQSIPEMSLILIQAFGRLIRHRDDSGVVAIMDPRLKSKGYGAQILRALPPAPVTTDIREAMTFLRAA